MANSFYLDNNDIGVLYNIRVLSIKGLWGTAEYKDYHKRDWIENDGLEVLVPTDRKTKDSRITLEGLCKGRLAKDNLQTFFEYLRTHGVMTLTDYNYWETSCSVVAEKIDIVANVQRNGYQVIHFKVEFTNVTGKELVNENTMVQIPNLSDFEIQTTLRDMESRAINPALVNWKLEYFTTGGTPYEATGTAGVYAGCTVEGNVIHIMIDGYDWIETGILYRRVSLSWNDTDFADGTQDIVTAPTESNIEII